MQFKITIISMWLLLLITDNSQKRLKRREVESLNHTIFNNNRSRRDKHRNKWKNVKKRSKKQKTKKKSRIDKMSLKPIHYSASYKFTRKNSKIILKRKNASNSRNSKNYSYNSSNRRRLRVL